MIGRRTLLAGLGALAATPRGAAAQTPGKTPRVGYITSAVRTVNADAFDQGMWELGYEIGRIVLVE
jgi:hypothetical protein